MTNLGMMLKICKEKQLVLNCDFVVKEGIVLGHRVSQDGLEVDRAKISTIEHLPPPVNMKDIRIFLATSGSIVGSSRISLK